MSLSFVVAENINYDCQKICVTVKICNLSVYHAQAESVEQPQTSTLGMSKDSIFENEAKEGADSIMSDNTSTDSVVHVIKNAKKPCQRKRPKSLSSPLKTKHRKKSSLRSPANSKKVGVLGLT